MSVYKFCRPFYLNGEEMLFASRKEQRMYAGHMQPVCDFAFVVMAEHILEKIVDKLDKLSEEEITEMRKMKSPLNRKDFESVTRRFSSLAGVKLSYNGQFEYKIGEDRWDPPDWDNIKDEDYIDVDALKEKEEELITRLIALRKPILAAIRKIEKAEKKAFELAQEDEQEDPDHLWVVDVNTYIDDYKHGGSNHITEYFPSKKSAYSFAVLQWINELSDDSFVNELQSMIQTGNTLYNLIQIHDWFIENADTMFEPEFINQTTCQISITQRNRFEVNTTTSEQYWKEIMEKYKCYSL